MDHLRGFVIALVVLHHSVLAYCRFGHIDRRHHLLSTAPVVDAQHWVGFDVLVTLGDGFFMPLMFLLSGLFVRRSLRHRGAGAYLRRRVLRLGVPYAAAVLTVVPLAYYPSWLQAGGAPGFPRFWASMLTVGPWPAGPPWFIAVLLAFDVIAVLAFAGLRDRFHGPFMHVASTPGRTFGLFLLGLVSVTTPLLALFGPSRWISFGPLAVQGSRIGLYAVSFAAGVLLGRRGLEEESASLLEAVVRRSPAWTLLAAAAGAILIGTQAARFSYGGMLPAWMWLGADAVALASFCAAACFALPALCLRFAGRPNRVWGSLAASSYGIYLLHYPVVTWVQFGLLHVPLGTIGKAGVTFAAALLLSWTVAVLLRHLPSVAAAGQGAMPDVGPAHGGVDQP